MQLVPAFREVWHPPAPLVPDEGPEKSQDLELREHPKRWPVLTGQRFAVKSASHLLEPSIRTDTIVRLWGSILVELAVVRRLGPLFPRLTVRVDRLIL